MKVVELLMKIKEGNEGKAMLEEAIKDSIFEERKEQMVSPLSGIPQLRKAHFLKPIVSFIEGPNLKLPSLPFSAESEWPLKVAFNGCRHDQNKWKKWVENMESIHHSFYKEKVEWAIVEGKILDQELKSFVRCLRVCELVGLDCQEPYRPNRVAMQFGHDQDFPKWIPRSPLSSKLAWYDYSRQIDCDLRLYYPSRLSKSDVTTQYLKWWRKEALFLADAFEGLLRERRSKRRLKRLSNLYGSPVFAPTLKQVKIETDYDVCNVPPKVDNYPDVPPGFPPKCDGENDKKICWRFTN
ncbi:hypothetical protein RND71_003962 [Anisodus tanguticus]|uniref:Aminotransferase-like plant mobile domain-containing protein n=1 Tax=Anisodus tanguticus TaxID=243964 RepID=A0AAE1VUI6_9SOLA|nr:hypothetical protein RND71_003962 [Anisodus tanguticus]